MNFTSHNGQGDFKRIVELHRPRIEKAYNAALEKLNSYTDEQRAEWNLLTIAVVMHSHVCHAMRRVFAEVPGATAGVEKMRAFVLELDGAPHGIPEVVHLKCKQVDEKLITANIPTEAVKAFNCNPPRRRHIQDPLHPFFGPPKTVDSEPPARGNAGYILDELKRGFSRLVVTYMTGLRSAELVLELSTSTPAEVVTLPIGEISEAPKKRVKAKATVEREKPKKRIKIEAVEIEIAKQDESKSEEGK